MTVKPILNIGQDEQGRTVMGGLIEEKETCLKCIADCIRLIVNYKPSVIVRPVGFIEEEKKVEVIK